MVSDQERHFPPPAALGHPAATCAAVGYVHVPSCRHLHPIRSRHWHRWGIGARPFSGVPGLDPTSHFAQADALFKHCGRIQRHTQAEVSGGSMFVENDASVGGYIGDVAVSHCCVAHVPTAAVAGNIL